MQDLTLLNTKSEAIIQDIKVFNCELGSIRVIIDNNEPLFMASDLCQVLEYKNGRDTINRLFPKGVAKYYTPTNGGNQLLSYLTEPQMYKLIMRSNAKNAEAFQDWICNEVLPSIRKTGAYSIQPLSQIEILQSSIAILAEQEKKISLLEQKSDDLHKEQLKVKHNINRLLNNDNYMTLIAFMNLHNIKQKGYHLPSLGKKAKKLSLEQGAFMGAVIDPRYGRINTYSTEILKQIFKVAIQ